MELEISQQVDKFLSVVRSKLEAKDELMALQAPQLAPGFNSLEVLCPDENRLSSIIAMLLDPRGEHGQGDIYLKLFFWKIGITLPIYEIARTTRICEEGTTLIEKSNRRIDILLDLDGFGLAIENKPWAADQKNQLFDYETYLKRRFGESNYVLIYLSGDGSDPDEISTSIEQRENIKNRDGKLKVHGYDLLESWVGLCIEKCQSIRVRCFLEDFRGFLLKKFHGVNDMTEKSIVISEALKKPENIRAVFLIKSLWPEIAKNYIENLADLVYKLILSENNFDQSVWAKPNVDFSLHDKCKGFSFKKEAWIKYVIKFEFEGTNASRLAYGVVKTAKDKNYPDLKELHNHLYPLYGGKHDPPWWPWYCDMEREYFNWDVCDAVWSGIFENGPTVKRIAEKLKKLVLDKNVIELIDRAEKAG